MNLQNLVRNPDGSVNFEASFDENQAKFVFEVGLNFLMMNGASTMIPKVTHPSPETSQ